MLDIARAYRARGVPIAVDTLLDGPLPTEPSSHGVAALMHAAHARVRTSRWEDLPMVLLQAAGASLPIMTAYSRGRGVILGHGAQAGPVPAVDPEALAAVSDGFLALDPSARRRRGVARRYFVAECHVLELRADECLRVHAGPARAPASTVDFS